MESVHSPQIRQVQANGTPTRRHDLLVAHREWLPAHRDELRQMVELGRQRLETIVGCADCRTVHANDLGWPGLGLLSGETAFSEAAPLQRSKKPFIYQSHHDCLAMKRVAEEVQNSFTPEDDEETRWRFSREGITETWRHLSAKKLGVGEAHLTEKEMRNPPFEGNVLYVDSTRAFTPQLPFPSGPRVSLLAPEDISWWMEIRLRNRVMDQLLPSIHFLLTEMQKKHKGAVTIAVVRDSNHDDLSSAVQVAAEKASYGHPDTKVISFDENATMYERLTTRDIVSVSRYPSVEELG
ncbi:MAG: hypothetical protein Q7R81_01165 [Candidatus Peregrinibacteria bacterium]|nr:hypothetical protein [Candidatus Peregrinibacteria bacterium]